MSVIEPNVEWLLDYEIEISARHRRFISLVMICADSTSKELDRILCDTIRSSDICFPEEEGISVVMGETGNTDAVRSIHRYGSTLNGSVNAHYSVASYPSDGKTSAELIRVAQRRMEKARSLGIGAVVAEG